MTFEFPLGPQYLVKTKHRVDVKYNCRFSACMVFFSCRRLEAIYPSGAIVPWYVTVDHRLLGAMSTMLASISIKSVMFLEVYRPSSPKGFWSGETLPLLPQATSSLPSMSATEYGPMVWPRWNWGFAVLVVKDMRDNTRLWQRV